MKISGASQAELIKYALIGGLIIGAAYYLKSLWEKTDLNPFDKDGALSVLGEKAGTLAEGLSHPIDALGALVGIGTSSKSTVQFTQNFDYYIKLNGGAETYTKKHQNGTFNGAPYDAAVDYRARYSQQLFTWGGIK